MREGRVRLLLVAFAFLVVSSSLLMKSHASGLSGIGIGIRKEGPTLANINDTIAYVVVVYNLGDYWIRSTTLTDRFPNGTSSSWIIPDIAPLGHSGDSFNVSGILYTIRYTDMSGSDFVLNHAEATGYADVQGSQVLVHAETNYITFVHVPVGGYSVSIKTKDVSTPTMIYGILLLTLAAVLPVAGACRRRVYRKGKTAREALIHFEMQHSTSPLLSSFSL
jgi:uncharacterized repeat protein (TIGR01451 family)